MSHKSVITQEMLKTIGTESDPVVHKIEKSSIIRFARAIGDPNPLFSDEYTAQKTRYEGIVAPPTFLRSLDDSPTRVQIVSPYSAFLDGGSQWEYFLPVRPGDHIKVIIKITDIFERQGKLGNMIFVISESKYVNQTDDTVAKQHGTDIWYRPD